MNLVVHVHHINYIHWCDIPLQWSMIFFILSTCLRDNYSIKLISVRRKWMLITLFIDSLEREQIPDEQFLDVFVCNVHSTDNICVNLSGENYSVSVSTTKL